MILSLLILLNLLCLGSPFHRLQVCSSRCFSCLPPVAKFGSVACVGFLVAETSACVLVDKAGWCLSGKQFHVWWCVLGCLWPYLTSGSLSANGWHCVPVLLVVWHRVSSIGVCWLLSVLGSLHCNGDLWEIFAIRYYMELGGLFWTKVLNLALSP